MTAPSSPEAAAGAAPDAASAADALAPEEVVPHVLHATLPAELPPTTGSDRWARYSSDRAVAGALIRYRVLATIVGISLVLLFAGIPLQVAGHGGLENVLGLIHGVVFFPLYLIASFDLSRRVRWSVPATVSVLVAGVVPIGSFYVEHRVRTNVETLLKLRASGTPVS